MTAYLIPSETGTLFALMETTSIYSRKSYQAIEELSHIVICGNVTVPALRTFCEELFHEDHGDIEINLVILNSSKPNSEMKRFLHEGSYAINLIYVQGNPMFEKDLNRCDIQKAKAIVIMTDKFTMEPHSIDHKNILIALEIKIFLLKNKVYESTLFIQLNKPENGIHFITGVQSLSVNKSVSADRLIVVEEIKMNLLSKSCLIPGIIPFVANLVKSCRDSKESTGKIWLDQYLEGNGMEIYRTKLNETFKNKSFSEISSLIYNRFDAIAFALEIEIEGKTIIALNPGPFFIEKNVEERTDIKFYIYCICGDKDDSEKIENADATLTEYQYAIKIEFQIHHSENLLFCSLENY